MATFYHGPLQARSVMPDRPAAPLRPKARIGSWLRTFLRSAGTGPSVQVLDPPSRLSRLVCGPDRATR
jgi:hypothetical protein